MFTNHGFALAGCIGSVADNTATFPMTNMMFQAPINNQQTWARLEYYGRALVAASNEVYIIARSYGVGGIGINGYATTISSGRITVPGNCWKVMGVLPAGTGDAGRVTPAPASSPCICSTPTPSVRPGVAPHQRRCHRGGYGLRHSLGRIGQRSERGRSLSR